MSGPKCGAYDAAAARMRRESEAAERALDAALSDIDRFNRVERPSANEAYGISADQIKRPERPMGTSAVYQTALELREQLAASRKQLDESCARARQASLGALFTSNGGADGPSVVRRAEAHQAVLDEELWSGRVGRALADLPASATAAEYQQVEHYAKQARASLDDPSGSAEDVRSFVTALERVAFASSEAAATRTANLEVALALRERILAVEADEEGTQLLAVLETTVSSRGQVPLSAGLDRDVTFYLSRRAQEIEESDRLLVLAAARQTLAEQGFDLGDEADASTVVDCLVVLPDELAVPGSTAPEGVAAAAKSAVALRFRENDGELQFNLVRVATDDATATQADHWTESDREAETTWCESFGRFREVMEARGIDIDLTVHMEPGVLAMHQMTLAEVEAEFGMNTVDRLVASTMSATTTAAVVDEVIAEPQIRHQGNRR